MSTCCFDDVPQILNVNYLSWLRQSKINVFLKKLKLACSRRRGCDVYLVPMSTCRFDDVPQILIVNYLSKLSPDKLFCAWDTIYCFAKRDPFLI